MMHRLIPILPKWNSNFLPRAVSSGSKSSSTSTKTKPSESPKATEEVSENSEKSALSKSPETSKSNKPTLIAQAFAKLDQKEEGFASHSSISKRIKQAKDVQSLLDIAGTPNLSRKSALSILSHFGDWTAANKIKLKDFENDERFLTMCRMLSKDPKNSIVVGDLATVLGVTGDDQAAKLINSATLGQMVQIIEKLSQGKKRSPPLLRSLAFNLSKCEEKLNIKQCADVLYAMASLSFHDEILLMKVCGDAVSSMAKDTRSAVVGSIARSVGIIRCRDTALLDELSRWLEANAALARPQDVVAILKALACVDYLPQNSEQLVQNLAPTLRPLDLPSAGLYLDAVWSLLVLSKQSDQQIAMSLSSDFIERLRKEDGDKLSVSTTLKLLNINAAAQYLISGYQGPKLSSDVTVVSLARSKEKSTLVNCVMETLLNLLPGENFLRRDVDSGAGFTIDGECQIDNNCTPLPVSGSTDKKAHRVAILVLGYHDTCVGARFQPNGIQTLSAKLLEARGYKVLTVLHSEFSPSSKLVNRVQYLERKLKALVPK